MRAVHSNSANVRGVALTTADADFSLAQTPRDNVITPGTTSGYESQDLARQYSSPSAVDREADVTATPITQDVFDYGVTFSSLDTSIATVDQAGVVTRVADGTARIKISTPRISRIIRVDVSRDASAAADVVTGFATGSLAEHASANVDDRIVGLTPSVAKPIYSSQDHTTPAYTRNASCWAADLDLTGISPWNSRGAAKRAGTLVTPRDMLCAEHYPLQAGDTVRLVKADNSVVTMTIDAVSNVGPPNSSDGYVTDIQVVTFTGDVPAGIAYYKVGPDDLENYLPSVSQLRVPVLCLDQEEKALVSDLGLLDTIAGVTSPTDSQRLAFHEDKISGDSGNPALLIADLGSGDELILLTTWTFGGGGAGPDIADHIAAINTQITANGSPYALTVADLSSWPDYTAHNLLSYSEDLSQASAWDKSGSVTVTAAADVAPNGTQTATKCDFPDGGGYWIRQQPSVAAETQYTFSVWLKLDAASTGSNIRISFEGDGTGGSGYGYFVTTLTTSWARYTRTVTTKTDATVLKVLLYLFGGDVGPVTLYAWGAQLNLGTIPAGYQST